MASATAVREGIYKSGLARRVARWLDAIPHPPVAMEIAADRVAVARWGGSGALDAFAIESFPPGAVIPSAVETNLVNPGPAKSAVAKACERLRTKAEDVALILPDPVIRVFVQHFEDFPRSSEEAIPLLRWKLKKSVPFEADETIISYFRQRPRESGAGRKPYLSNASGRNLPRSGLLPGHLERANFFGAHCRPGHAPCGVLWSPGTGISL